MRFKIATFLVCLAAVGCNEDMESISQVTKFRVMAVQAEPPEIRPGQGTTMRVLYADPKGDGREVTIMWLTCVGSFSPTADISIDPDAGGAGCEPLWMPGLGAASEGGDTYHIPVTQPDILRDLPEDDEFLPVTAIVVLCAGGSLPEPDTMDMTGQIDSFDEFCRGGDGLVAVKTLRISNSENPNRNPIIEGLSFNAVPLAALEQTEGLDGGTDAAPEADAGVSAEESGDMDAGLASKGQYECDDPIGCRDRVSIEAFLTDESFQKYTKVTFGDPEEQTENPYISWFVTGGSFTGDRSRTEDHEDSTKPRPFQVDWKPPRDGGTFRLWAVAHDMRGGASWQTYTISAAVPK